MQTVRQFVDSGSLLTRYLAHCVFGLAFPNQCLCCHAEIDFQPQFTTQWLVCDACQELLINDDRKACRRCGCPIGPYLPVPDRCLRCQRKSYQFHEVIRLGLYRDELRKAVIEGKSATNRAICVQLARLLVREQRERLEAAQPDVVVPVPSHWLKRLFVPHHQAELLAWTIARELKLPLCTTVLLKRRFTQDQSDLPREHRVKNLTNAFVVRRPHRIAGRRVLLVDDVMTTRTTASECAWALKQAGGARVIATAIAVVE